MKNKKYMRMSKVLGCLLLCGCLLLLGCKTRKDSVSSLSGMDEERIFKAMVDHSLQFQTLSGKLNIEIATPQKSFSSKANLKIVKNEAIQLSVQPFFGMEAFRMTLTKDSICIIDRINQQYALESTRDIKGNTRMDFNFYNLQALFTNSIFLAGETQIYPSDYKKFTMEKTSKLALIQTTDRQGIQYLFSGDYEGKIQSLYMSSKGNRTSLLSDYNDFRDVSGSQLFPMYAKMTLKESSGNEYHLNFAYSSVELDKNLELKFDIPAKYKYIRLSDALHIIKKL